MSLSNSLNCTDKVSYINGEPVQMLSDMLEKLARGGTTANHRIIKNNAELESICERVAKGDLDSSDDKVPGGASLQMFYISSLPCCMSLNSSSLSNAVLVRTCMPVTGENPIWVPFKDATFDFMREFVCQVSKLHPCLHPLNTNSPYRLSNRIPFFR